MTYFLHSGMLLLVLVYNYNHAIQSWMFDVMYVTQPATVAGLRVNSCHYPGIYYVCYNVNMPYTV